MIWSRAVKLRKGIQVFFLALFIILLVLAVEQRQAPLLADLFFRINPLSALMTSLATRSWVSGLVWALLTIGLTLLVGRAWCGWICPTGTLLEWAKFHWRSSEHYPRLRSFKNIFLLIILVAAVLGNLTLLVFDPISLLTRTMGVSVIPALNHGINEAEVVLYQLPILRPLVDRIEGVIRGVVLPVKQPAFAQNLLIAMLFLEVLSLNLLAPRFWCRYLCPLGALLGWLSRIALFRPVVGAACNRCTRCALVCQPGAVDTHGEKAEILPSECTVCLDCLADCKKGDIHFQAMFPTFLSHKGRNVPTPPGDKNLAPPPELIPLDSRKGASIAPSTGLTRRQFLGSLAAGLIGVMLLRSDLRARQRDSRLIRPPGSQDENAFLSACLRCSQCMKICPTSALQPAAFEAGLEGLWTPILVARVGYCDYGCNACGQVCPSGAIPNLDLEQKRTQVIAKASVNRDRCLPWASATPCIVCEEMCPTPAKSIRLEVVTLQGIDGQPITLQRPYVIRDLCIGCGICENHCPLEGEAAIRVYGI